MSNNSEIKKSNSFKNSLILTLVAGLLVILSTIIGTIIDNKWTFSSNKKIISFDEEKLGILILPFDPIENINSNDENMALALFKNISNKIISNSLDNFEVKYELDEKNPKNHIDVEKLVNSIMQILFYGVTIGKKNYLEIHLEFALIIQ